MQTSPDSEVPILKGYIYSTTPVSKDQLTLQENGKILRAWGPRNVQ